MLKKIFITFLILLVGYSIIIRFVKDDLDTAQYTEQENVIKGERYFFSTKDTITGVMLGSSLTAVVKTENIKGLYNLSQGGSGALDGLELVLKKKNKPRFVLIETNYIYRPLKAGFQDHFDGSNAFLLTHLPILMSKNQPTGVITGLLRKKLKRHSVSPLPVESNNTETEPFFKVLLANQQNSYNHPPKDEVLKSVFLKLSRDIQTLEKAGSKVYFYEMPVNRSLKELPLAKIIRHDFQIYFPNANYIIFPDEEISTYQSRDGIHLNKYSAQLFSERLKNHYEALK